MFVKRKDNCAIKTICSHDKTHVVRLSVHGLNCVCINQGRFIAVMKKQLIDGHSSAIVHGTAVVSNCNILAYVKSRIQGREFRKYVQQQRELLR